MLATVVTILGLILPVLAGIYMKIIDNRVKNTEIMFQAKVKQQEQEFAERMKQQELAFQEKIRQEEIQKRRDEDQANVEIQYLNSNNMLREELVNWIKRQQTEIDALRQERMDCQKRIIELEYTVRNMERTIDSQQSQIDKLQRQ
jgi:hypothetical protein